MHCQLLGVTTLFFWIPPWAHLGTQLAGPIRQVWNQQLSVHCWQNKPSSEVIHSRKKGPVCPSFHRSHLPWSKAPWPASLRGSNSSIHLNHTSVWLHVSIFNQLQFSSSSHWLSRYLRSIVALVKGLTGLLYFVIRGVSVLSICSSLIKTEAVLLQDKLPFL